MTGPPSEFDIPTLPPAYFSVGQPTAAVPLRRIQRQRRPASRVPLNSLSDNEVWDKTDEQICNAARASWKSPVYDHYDTTLIRHTRDNPHGDGTLPDYLEYSFTCRTDSERHPVQYCRRSETHRGTGNLKASMDACLIRNNQESPTPEESTSTTFSYAMHLAIIVMMCAYHYLPFAGVLHDLVRRHVQLLRPGTMMPNSTTVSRTTRVVYERQGEKVRDYFKGIDIIHMAIDGWTSPTATAYLGLVVHWYSEGQMWRAVLEMIRLEKKHTGEYLAQKTAECLWRYGIGSKLLTVCMDNASNNDTFTWHLPALIPEFLGSNSRVRCAAHVTNLVVKAFTTYFVTLPPRKRKVAKTKTKISRKQRHVTRSTAVEEDLAEPELVVAEDGGAANTDSEDEFEEKGATEESSSIDDIDAAKALYDKYVIKGTMESALQYARQDLKLDITDDMLSSAHAILTMASKIARKIHEKPELKHLFGAHIDQLARSLKTNKRSLARRIPTRWNSDFECLLSVLELRVCVEALIRDLPGELGGLKFSDYQWLLIEQIVRVLKIFKEITNFFSQSGVPLVHEVVPMFIRMRQKLEQVRDNKPGDLKPIVQVAAHSSLLVIDKYMDLFKESEVYWIALVMCPNYKLKWLRDNGFTDSDVSAVHSLVVRRFNSIFTTGTVPHFEANLANSVGVDLPAKSDDEWDLGDSSNTGTACVFDSIEDYLSTEPVSPLIVKAAGGPIQHWQSQLEPTARLRLARFALNYLSAPASLVDVERAFSCGRLTVNHLQHQMSPDTFCAKMALQSWYGTPLMNSVEEVAALLEGKEHVSLD